MMLAEGELDAPPGMQVQHRREVENPFIGGISVRSPHHRTSGRSGWLKSRPGASGALRADLSRLVVDRQECFALATRCGSAITAATVFSLTRHPRSRRSAVIRGDPR